MGYLKNWFYFYGLKKLLFFGILGVILGIVCFCQSAPEAGAIFSILGVVLACIGWITPSDPEIDRQGDNFLEAMDAQAFKKLGIDESEVSMAKPVKFWGFQYVYPSYLGDSANDRCPWKVGGDKIIRTSEVVVTGFYFGENSVYCFERANSLVSDAFKETSEEYFYKDIVSVKTETENKPFVGTDGKEDPRRRVRSEKFCITNKGGERREFYVKVAQKAEEASLAFRALLKQKKI